MTAFRHLWDLSPLAAAAVVFLTSSSMAAGAPTDAAHIYLRDCASCHGAEARGTEDGPSLQGAGAGLVDYELTTGRMPLPDPDAEVVRRLRAAGAVVLGKTALHEFAFGTTNEDSAFGPVRNPHDTSRSPGGSSGGSGASLAA